MMRFASSHPTNRFLATKLGGGKRTSLRGIITIYFNWSLMRIENVSPALPNWLKPAANDAVADQYRRLCNRDQPRQSD
jgi:hypothetical protein